MLKSSDIDAFVLAVTIEYHSALMHDHMASVLTEQKVDPVTLNNRFSTVRQKWLLVTLRLQDMYQKQDNLTPPHSACWKTKMKIFEK